MRQLTLVEQQRVTGAQISVQKITSSGLEVVVTELSRFVSAGTYGGHRLNVILYANDVCDLYDKSLGYDLSETFFHNGHLVKAIPIADGHIYQFMFNEG